VGAQYYRKAVSAIRYYKETGRVLGADRRIIGKGEKSAGIAGGPSGRGRDETSRGEHRTKEMDGSAEVRKGGGWREVRQDQCQ